MIYTGIKLYAIQNVYGVEVSKYRLGTKTGMTYKPNHIHTTRALLRKNPAWLFFYCMNMARTVLNSTYAALDQ
jgi:hypothetical protein